MKCKHCGIEKPHFYHDDLVCETFTNKKPVFISIIPSTKRISNISYSGLGYILALGFTDKGDVWYYAENGQWIWSHDYNLYSPP